LAGICTGTDKRLPGGDVAVPRSHRFLIADDHPLFRDALRQVISARFGDGRIDEAGTFEEVVACLGADDDVDLILLDLAMPGVHRFSGLMFLRAEHPAVPVVVVSATDEAATIRQAVALGASGYIPKSLAIGAISEAISAVLSGALWMPADVDLEANSETKELISRLVTLTPQQIRVLMMLSEGLLNKQIAHALDVSEATVKAHVSAVLQKLGVDSRTQAVIAASRIEAGHWQSLSQGL
jgi:DNA-binding NarL/FixJ family response regulator